MAWLNKAHLEVLQEGEFGAGERILDAGCGTGALLYLLAQNLRGESELVGVDLSKEMLDVAKERLQEFPNVTVHRNCLEEFSDPGGSFDQILCVNVLHYLEDPAGVWHELSQHLKAHGKLMVITPWKEPFPLNILCNFFRGFFDPAYARLYTFREIRRSLERAGFTILSRKVFHIRGCSFALLVKAAARE